MGESSFMLALAGLLHDVGKFAVRAGERGTRIPDSEMQRDFGYFHALLTSDFIEKHVPEPWRLVVKNAASNHHRPTDRASRILALADHFSAGERADRGADDRAAQPRQLLSIFCSLTADGQRAPADAYWPLAPLALDEKALLPGPAMADDGVWQSYRKMWDAFCAEAARLRDSYGDGGAIASYLESLLLLHQRYTWCMPSAYYKNQPDISLYDHVRMTAALAAVLEGGDLPDARLDELLAAPEADRRPLALLVGGDVSGVQDFIYTITARGAASSLRGRSFYLQLLAEAAARFVLNRLSLPITNLVYAGGGNFYLLARPGDEERLRDVQREISRSLLQHHRGDLYVALARQVLTGEDFFSGRISAAWGNLSEELERRKQQRFAELGDELALLFEPQGHGGSGDVQCAVCGAEHPGTKVDPKSRTEGNAEGVPKCPQCLSYEELGEDLRRARYLVLDEIAAAPGEAGAPGTWDVTLGSLGLKATVGEEVTHLPAPAGERRVLLALSDDALSGLVAGPRTAIGRRLLVNVTPTITAEEIRRLRSEGVAELPRAEATKPFHVLEKQAEGIKRLGVLRMDVDNLGDLFAKGLGERATLSRVASLSHAVSLYFEGWVAELARRWNRDGGADHDRVYSIYSGGDDLFFVGSWDAMPELAREIRGDLTRFAAGHPGIHASAGIALVGGKYPLYQAAADAGEAERQAKGLKWAAAGVEREKDAVSFLGQALPWEQFGLGPCDEPGVETAHALEHLLVSMVKSEKSGDKGAPQALLRRLIELHEQYAAVARKRREAGEDQNRAGQPQVLWGPWMWRGVYFLHRMAKDNADIKALQKKLQDDRFRSMEWIGLAARWAELYLRRESSE